MPSSRAATPSWALGPSRWTPRAHQTLAFAWACVPQGSGPCLGVNGSALSLAPDPILQLQLLGSPAGLDYSFSVTVSKGIHIGQAEIADAPHPECLKLGVRKVRGTNLLWHRHAAREPSLLVLRSRVQGDRRFLVRFIKRSLSDLWKLLSTPNELNILLHPSAPLLIDASFIH